MLGDLNRPISYNLSGQEDQVHKLGLEALKLKSNLSAEEYMKAVPFKTKDQFVRFAIALRKASLPE